MCQLEQLFIINGDGIWTQQIMHHSFKSNIQGITSQTSQGILNSNLNSGNEI
jgi:hypothetical protein